jgi:hypothetical protein
MSGNFLKGESRQGIEAPQNYGFTSHCMPADKDELGNITHCAEVVMSFVGGNRGFPVAGNMDDRRHRLTGLDPGDSAMFRTKDDYQQFHMHSDGGFWSGAINKTLRMALVNQQAGQQQQGSQGGGAGGQVALRDGSSGSSGGGAGSQGGQSSKPTGQKSVKSANQQATVFVDMTQTATRMAGKEVHAMLDDGKVYGHWTGQQQYCGGQNGKDKFAKVVTTAGPAKNVWGKIG